jgi:hypothetical protein
MDDPKATRANLDPGATAIYIERGGILVWGGILWTVDTDNSERKLNLGGEGFWSYFKHRTIHNRTAMSHATSSSSFTFLPDGDSTSTGVQGTPNNTDLWKNVDQPPTANTAIQSVTPGFIEYTANFDIDSDQVSGLVITAVRLNAWVSSTNQPVVLELEIGGTPYRGPTTLPGGSIEQISYTWQTNPDTGVAWTSSDVEDFASGSSAGIFCFSNNIADISLWSLTLQVTWGAGGTAVFQGTDELAIARDLINNAQAQPGGDLNINVGTELTTDTGNFTGRSVTYHDYEFKIVSEAISELAGMANGFDYSIEVAWNGTTPERNLHLYYPRRGSRIPGLVFNGNMEGIAKVGLNIDATIQSNSVHALGAGEGDTATIVTATDTSLFSRYLLMEATFSAKDLDDVNTLAALASAQLTQSRVPQELPSLQKQADTWPDVGAFTVGDEALVRVDDGYIQIDSYQRVQSIEIEVDDEGQELMTPIFVSSDQVAF